MKLKSTIITLIFGLLFLLNSCNSDKDSETDNSPSISLMGKWEFDKTITNGKEYDNINPDGCKRSFLLFQNNICTEGQYESSNCTLRLYPNNYIYENNVIKIIYSEGSSFEKKVLELTNTTLKTSSYNGRDIDIYKKIN